MSTEHSEKATILVVEDEEDVADLYALFLSESYDVRTAYSGQEALTELDDDVDAVLLDRRMPEMSGDEVLDWIRDREYDARVAMVTAVDPGIDSAEMRYDDYVLKPVDKGQLEDTVEYLLDLDGRGESELELMATQLRQELLERTNDPEELEESDVYQRLRTKAETLEARINEGAERAAIEGMDLDRRLEGTTDTSIGRIESFRGIVHLKDRLSADALREMAQHGVEAETRNGEHYDPREILKLKAVHPADRNDALGRLQTEGVVDVESAPYALDPWFFGEGSHDVSLDTFETLSDVSGAQAHVKLGAVSDEDRPEARAELAEVGTVTLDWYDTRDDLPDAVGRPELRT